VLHSTPTALMQSPYVHPYFTTEPRMLIMQENAWDLRCIFPVTSGFVQTSRELWFQGKQSQGESPATTRKKEIR